jgi:hypothetical protein
MVVVGNAVTTPSPPELHLTIDGIIVDPMSGAYVEGRAEDGLLAALFKLRFPGAAPDTILEAIVAAEKVLAPRQMPEVYLDIPDDGPVAVLMTVLPRTGDCIDLDGRWLFVRDDAYSCSSEHPPRVDATVTVLAFGPILGALRNLTATRLVSGRGKPE